MENAKTKIYISFSFKHKAENGEVYNTALLIDRQGEIVSEYHKIHLTVYLLFQIIKHLNTDQLFYYYSSL